MVAKYYLPISVLLQILKIAVGPQAKTLSEWKAKLSLVHVSSLWSQLLQPAVFQSAYIHIQSDRSIKSLFRHPTPMFYYATNADLLISRDRYAHASGLCVYTDAPIDIHLFWNCVLAALRAEKYQWGSIRSFEVNWICSKHLQNYISKYSKPVELSSLWKSNPASLFYRCLPNIANFRLLDNAVSSNSKLVSELLHPYIDKLVALVCHIPLQFHDSFFSERLAVLDIVLDLKAPEVYIPQMLAGQLVCLGLYNLPLQFSWFQFEDEQKGSIVFGNLLELKLVYRKRKDTDSDNINTSEFDRMQYFQLHFPKLQKLTIENCPPDCAVFYSSDLF